MNHKVKDANIEKTVTVVLIVVSIVLMLHLQLFIQLYQHKRDVKRSSDILLNQVIEKIVSNDISEIILAADLRAEYIIRANIVSYIIENNPALENNIDELLRICRILSIDEIHFFNKEGEIYGGTIPAYYGMSFDSGEQIGYFKPMLNSVGMSMCQDPTPNTAEGRSMIYAIVWKRDGSSMVQIGVTPFRFFNEIRKNAIPKTISEIPVGEGIELFVADKDTNEIFGATFPGYVDKQLDEIGIHIKGKTFFRATRINQFGKKETVYCRIRLYKTYYVGLIETRASFNRVLFLTLSLLFIYLCIAAFLIVMIIEKTNSKIKDEREKRLELQEKMLKSLQEQFSIVNGVGADFEDIVLVNTESKTASMIKKHGEIGNYEASKNSEGRPYDEVWDGYIKKNVLPDDVEALKNKVDLNHIQSELDKKKEYYITYRCHHDGNIFNLQAKFMKVNSEDSNSKFLFFAIRNIDEILEEQQRLAMLEKEAKLDRLTGFHNRSSYEDDINNGSPKYFDENMIYLSLDVNGLKQTNDNFGHAKGDELLRGAASCMHQCFSPYGRVYRTGGDEFCAIIFADSLTLDAILKDFNETTEAWSKENNLDLAVSLGYALRKDEKSASVLELSKIADKAMYYNKAQFYKNKGFDRRGEYRFSSPESKN